MHTIEKIKNDSRSGRGNVSPKGFLRRENRVEKSNISTPQILLAKTTIDTFMTDYSPLLEAELGHSGAVVTPTNNSDGIPDPPESGLSDAEAQRLLEIYGKYCTAWGSFYPLCFLSNNNKNNYSGTTTSDGCAHCWSSPVSRVSQTTVLTQ